MKIHSLVCILIGLVTGEIVAIEVLSYSGARKDGWLWVLGLFVAYTFDLSRAYLIQMLNLRDRGRF